MLNGYMVIMLVLFTNFYIKEYVTRSNDAKRRKLKEQESTALSAGDATPKKSPRANGVTKRKAA
jgi:hypothetical protein